MYAPGGPDTRWLDFTNVALGLVTLVFVIVVAGGVARELRVLRGRARRRIGRPARFQNIPRG